MDNHRMGPIGNDGAVSGGVLIRAAIDPVLYDKGFQSTGPEFIVLIHH